MEKREFVTKLHKLMMKEANEIQRDKVILILNDVVQFLQGTNNYKITQQILGREMLFREFITKDWTSNEITREYLNLN